MNTKSRMWMAASLAAMTAMSHGQAHWLTATSGNWSDNSKWAAGSAPAGGTVYIDYTPWSLTGSAGSFTTALNYSVTLTALLSKANLTMSGVSLGLSAGGSILDGSLTMTNSSITGGGITFNGSATITGSITLSTGAFVFNGATSLGSNPIHTVNSMLTFNNVLTVGDGVTRDGILNIGPAGTFRKSSGAGTFNVGQSWNGGPVQFNNAGVVESLSGTLSPTPGGTHTGTFRGSGSGLVSLGSGIHTMLAGARIETGAQLSGATISIPTAADTLQIIGTPDWTDSTISSGGGRLIGAGTLNLISTSVKGIAGTLTNQTNLNFSNGIIQAVNSTFNNQGSMVVDGTRTYRDGIFNNQASLTKTGAGQAVFGQSWNGGPIQFNNSGTVTVTGGGLSLYASGTHTGTFTGSGGTVDFTNNSSHTFMPGHVLYSGVNLHSGAFLIPDGGTLNCAGTVNVLGGTVARQGSSGVAYISGGGSLTLPGSAATFAGVLQNNGVINLNAATLHNVNSTLTNAGTLNFSGAGNYRDGVLNNTGTITKSGAGQYLINEGWSGGPSSFNNSGLVSVSAGSLSMRANGTHSGVFNGNGGQLIWPTGTQTCSNGTEFLGNNLFNGATISVPAGQQVKFNGATLTSGTLTGAGTLIGNSTFLWNGAHNLSGTLTNATQVSMVSDIAHAVNATFTNNGTMLMNASSIRDGILINNGLLKGLSGLNRINEGWSGGPVFFRNNGQVIADNSTINAQQSGEHTGSFRTANGGTVNFTGGSHTLRNGSILGTGTLTNTTMVCNESTVIEGESEFQSGAWTGTGTIYGDTWRWSTASSRSLGGSLTCGANINHEGGAVHAVNASFTLDNATATLANGVTWRDGVWINNGRVQKLEGVNQSSLAEPWSGGTTNWTNNGTLHCEAGTLRLYSTLINWNNGTSTMNGGVYSAKGTGRLWLPIGGVVTNLGRFILDGASAQVTQSNGSTAALAPIATNQGGIELYSGANLTPPAAFTNSGDVVVGAGSNLTPVGTYTQTGGHSKVNGTINKLLTVSGGRLSGKGSIMGATVSGSTVAPGDAVGTLTSSANVSMGNCTFDAKVAGAGAGQFSKLLVTGTAAITNGTLLADAAPNSTVPSGTVVDIITATSRTGTFTTVPPVADWSVSYGATFVRLTANRTITGPIQIEGNLDLDGYVAGYATSQLTFVLEQGGNPIETQNINPFADRTYRLITRLRGGYDLTIRGSHWLTRRIPALSLTDAGISGLNIDLINGDVDQDNEIGPGDFAALSSAFGSVDGDANWNANADLDGDEEIGPGDFSIISANFGMSGD